MADLRVHDPDLGVHDRPILAFTMVRNAHFREGSPEAAESVFFVGFPLGILRRFEVFAKDRPELAQWTIRAQDDNGIIESVTTDGATTPAP
jgi:hypothetical protein